MAPFVKLFTDFDIAENRANDFARAIVVNDPYITGPQGLREIFDVYGEEAFRRDVLRGSFGIGEVSQQLLFVSALKQVTLAEIADEERLFGDEEAGYNDPEKKAQPVSQGKKGVQYHAFLTHNWGEDMQKRNNHKRVVQFKKELAEHGIENLWLDEERMTGNIVQQMCDGIDDSKLVIVFITQSYIDKVAGRSTKGTHDNCLLEFRYAARKKGTLNLIAVVMEEACTDAANWDGPVSFYLGGELYYSFKHNSELKRCAREVAAEIRLRLGEPEFKKIQSKKDVFKEDGEDEVSIRHSLAKLTKDKFKSAKW